MATVTGQFSLTANTNEVTLNKGPMSVSLAASLTKAIDVDVVDHFTIPSVRTTYQAAGFAENAPYGQILVNGSVAQPSPTAKSDGTTLTHTGCYIYILNTTATTSKHIIAIGHTTHLDAAVDDTLDSFGADGTGASGGGSADSGSDVDLTPLVEANTDNFNSSNKRLFSLRPGEFAWFPYDYTGDLYAQATGASQSLEFWRFDRV